MERLLVTADAALRTLFAEHHSATPYPARNLPKPALEDNEQALAGALMRVNHVGEVCAQALYTAQAATTRNPALRAHFERAAHEETDHLAWTRQRLDELGDRVSLLNPLWYAGAFAIGLVAGRISDAVSLGFVVETERQVEAHLDEHLETLPDDDQRSRQIIEVMKADEARHADHAQLAGARVLPAPIPQAMAAASNLMKLVAYRL